MIYVVPNPSVSIIAPSSQIVGESLTLQCNVTTVRGITSRVDVVWSSGGTVLERRNTTTPHAMDSSLVYTGSYTISSLNTSDENRTIQCEVIINTAPLVSATDTVVLDVTGELFINIYET